MKSIVKNQYVLFWTFLGMLILPNLFMMFTEPTSVLTRVVNIILPLGLFWTAMTLKDKPGKMFWWLFLFIFFDAFEIVLLYLFGEGPVAVDMFLNVITTNVTEANELLFQIYPSVIFVVVVYVTGIVLSIISIRNKQTLHWAFLRNQHILGGIVSVVGFILLGVNYFVDRRFAVQDDIFPVNVTYNMGLSVDRAIKSARYPVTSRMFKHQAVNVRGDSVPEVYVLVIGETAKADNMSLYGYERNTTPLLKALNDSARIVAYRDALTMSNTTHKSVPLLLTAVGSELDYDSLYTQKGLISAFCEAGFATVYISNQRRNGSFIDYLGCEAEDIYFTKDELPMTANVYDEELVKQLNERLREHAGHRLLIVLHCYGSHFDYRDRYPQRFELFKPTEFPSATKKSRRELQNAYDNTIHYADYVLSQVMKSLEQCGQPAVMLYTSDHGEDIYDDERGRFLHASPNPTYYHMHVPFIVWASQQWRALHPVQWHNILRHKDLSISTGMVTFHTMLDLAGVKTRQFMPVHALGNAAFKPSQRLYVNDHNELHRLDDCGMRKQDVEQFRLHHIQYP